MAGTITFSVIMLMIVVRMIMSSGHVLEHGERAHCHGGRAQACGGHDHYLGGCVDDHCVHDRNYGWHAHYSDEHDHDCGGHAPNESEQCNGVAPFNEASKIAMLETSRY